MNQSRQKKTQLDGTVQVLFCGICISFPQISPAQVHMKRMHFRHVAQGRLVIRNAVFPEVLDSGNGAQRLSDAFLIVFVARKAGEAEKITCEKNFRGYQPVPQKDVEFFRARIQVEL